MIERMRGRSGLLLRKKAFIANIKAVLAVPRIVMFTASLFLLIKNRNMINKMYAGNRKVDEPKKVTTFIKGSKELLVCASR